MLWHDTRLNSCVLGLGVYVWGKDWIQAKTQAECYDYLFEAAVRMHGMGIDASRPPPPMLAAAGFVGTADGNRPAPDANGSTANGASSAVQCPVVFPVVFRPHGL